VKKVQLPAFLRQEVGKNCIGEDDGEMDEARHAGSMTYAISRFFRWSGNLLDNYVSRLWLSMDS
jgi:hypothetical protein